MAREVRVIQVRPRSFLDTPLITLPFIGDVPPRKLIYGFGAVSLAYLITHVTNLSGTSIIVLLITSFLVGFMLAKEPKAVSWEKQLLILITGSYRPKVPKPIKYGLGKVIKEEEVSITLSEVAEPVKIYGVITDPYTGEPLSTELKLFINGKEVSKTFSDSNGRYVFYTQLRPGTHLVEVKVGDTVVMRKKVIVSLRSR